MSGGAAVTVRNLTRRFGERTVLENLDVEIQRGEFVALLGRSGSGKSTLLRALADIDHEVTCSGTIEIPERVSVVFQDARLLPWLRVADNIVLGIGGPSALEAGRNALAEVELAGRETAWPGELSGGEQQRVALARALVREPELLLADEPFGALDALTRIRMHDLLRRLCGVYRPAVLLVTHDVDEAIELADRVLVLETGRIAADIAIRGAGRPLLDESTKRDIRNNLLGLLGVRRSAALSIDLGDVENSAAPIA